MKDEPASVRWTARTVPVLISISTAAVFAFSLAVLAQQTPANEPRTAEAEPKEAIPGELPVEIEFLDRFAQNYTLTFSSKLDKERFQITREQSANYSRATSILKMGETSQDGKFRLEKYEEKSETTPLGIKVDASNLVIAWLPTGQKKMLVRRDTKTIPTYFAKLVIPAKNDSPRWEEFVKEGAQFSPTSNSKLKFRLTTIEKEKATVEFKDAEGTLRKAEIFPQK